MHRSVPAALTGGAFVWLAALLIAPLAASSASVAFAVAASLVYEAAGFVCHQRADRSFHVAALQMPVCARCFGLYASGACGAAAAWIAARGVPSIAGVRAARIALALAAAPTAVTWLLEVAQAWQPGNVVRAIAAVPLGATVGWIVIARLRAENPAAVRSAAMRYHA